MRIGIIGFGSIGQELVRQLSNNPVDDLAVLCRPHQSEAARHVLDRTRPAKNSVVVDNAADLAPETADLILECAGHGAVKDHGSAMLRQGARLVIASVGALADDALFKDMTDAATDGGGRLIVPSGAIGGLDILSALAATGAVEVTYRGIKPALAWSGTEAEDLVDLDNLTKPTVFFDGNARDAARRFPKNANVAATLGLASGGMDAVSVQLIADPDANGNSHSYSVKSSSASYRMTIDNTVSSGNAKTSLTTVYSLLREIDRCRNRVVV